MKGIAIIAAASLLLIPVGRCAPSELLIADEPERNETEVQKERSPVTQKQDPQPPPQITFPFPFFPFRPDASLTPAMPQLPFTFPFLFPSFVPRPSTSARSLDLTLPIETFVISDAEDELRKAPTQDKKKPKKKKKKQQKKPKPIVVYQKENQVALEGPPMPPMPPAFAGQLANGNQGSYSGYYMVYLVEVSWNGSNQTQTIIAGRPVLAGNPSPTEAAQTADLTASMTESPFKPPVSTQCFFQRSTTADLSGVVIPPGPTGNPDQEIISEELETMEYDEDDPKKKKKKQQKSNTEAPVSPPT